MSDTPQIKPGDYVVRVAKVYPTGMVWIEGGGTTHCTALRPLPPALSAEDALRDPSEEESERVYAMYIKAPYPSRESIATALRDFLKRRRRPASPAAGVPQDGAWVPKVGDRVRVKDTGNIARVSQITGDYIFARYEPPVDKWVGISAHSEKFEPASAPPPPAPNVAALERAGLDALLDQARAADSPAEGRGDGTWAYENAIRRATAAGRALLAATAPKEPDAVAELREAAADVEQYVVPPTAGYESREQERVRMQRLHRLRAALAALSTNKETSHA